MMRYSNRGVTRSVTSVTATSLPVLFPKAGSRDGFAINPSPPSWQLVPVETEYGETQATRRLRPVKLVTEKLLKTLSKKRDFAKHGLKEEDWRVIQAAHSLRNALGVQDGREDELELKHAFKLLDINYAAKIAWWGGPGTLESESLGKTRRKLFRSPSHLLV